MRLLLPLLLVLAAPAAAEPLVAAHRGMSGAGHPENSMAAFRHAIDTGLAAVELDLRATRDAEIIIIHDPTVDRTTDGTGAVAKMSLAELKALDLGGGERIPSFAEVLDLARGNKTRLVLDIKLGTSLAPASVIDTARRHGALDRIVIGARSVADVRAFRAAAPDVPILGLMPNVGDVDRFARAGVNWIRLWSKWILAPAAGCASGPAPGCIVQKIQGRGLPVWALADAPADGSAMDLFRRLAALEPDAILTDRPDLAVAALAEGSPSP
jgi:glycerophosphoryl diester phosphodiesterase